MGVHGYRFSVPHMIRTVFASAKMKNQKDIPETADEILRMAFPDKFEETKSELLRAGYQIPGKDSVIRARNRVDICMMLMDRVRHVENVCSTTVRYLCPDASPQGGRELFCVMMEVLIRGDPQTVKRRRAPVVSLGHRCQALIDKAMQLVHVAYLQAGPKLADIQRWFEQVRIILTDEGTEAGIVDIANIIPFYLERNLGAAAKLVREMFVPGVPRTWLMPYAIRFPGWNHLLDNTMRGSFECMRWWSEL